MLHANCWKQQSCVVCHGLQSIGRYTSLPFPLKGGGGLSNLLVFARCKHPEEAPADMVWDMQDHRSMHRLQCTRIGPWYPNPTVAPATVDKKIEPDYVNIIRHPDGLQVAHQKSPASNRPERINSYEMVPATSSVHQQQSVQQMPHSQCQVPGPPQSAVSGSNQRPQNLLLATTATYRAGPQPTAAEHQQVYDSLPRQSAGRPEQGHPHMSHQESSLPPSGGGGWDGPRANNPTVFQNVPSHFSTTEPTPSNPAVFQNVPSHFSTTEPTSSNPTVFQNVPSHFSTTEPTSSNPAVFQNVPPPTSLAAGWEGDQANNPTTYKNVPNHFSTTKPTPNPFQNVPNHISTASSKTTAFQNVHPLTTHAAGWDGAWGDPKNPTIFQNYPCQLSDGQPTTMPALPHRKTISNVASEPSDDEDTVENGWLSTEQVCQVSRCSSQDSLIGNLPPPCIIFTSFEADTLTRIPSRLSQFSSSAGELNSHLSDTGPHHIFDITQTDISNTLKTTNRLSFENRQISISSEDGSSVDLYGSGPNLATTPTNSLQSLQLCPEDQYIYHMTKSSYKSLSSENGSSVDLYGSGPQSLPILDRDNSPRLTSENGSSVDLYGSGPNLATNPIYCPQSLARDNSPRLTSENGSSVDLYGSGPNLAITPPTNCSQSLPTLDKNSPPMTASRQTSLSSGSSSSVDLYGSGHNIPTIPRNGHQSLHQDEGEDVYSSDPDLSTTEKLLSSQPLPEVKATFSKPYASKLPPKQPDSPR